MIKLFEAKVTEKDNLLTALSKGMVEGVINNGVALLGIAGIVYALGVSMKNEEIEIEFEEEEKTEEV